MERLFYREDFMNITLEQQLEWAKNFREEIRNKNTEYFAPDTEYKTERSGIAITTSFGDTRVLVHRPMDAKDALPVYINLHGGGFVVGSADGDDMWCGLISARAGCAVYNVDYRLAPEHKFPTAIEEIYDIAKYLYTNANELGLNPDKIAIGGHSAGGNLATAVCLYNIDCGGGIPFVYQILDYPVLDLFSEPSGKPRHGDDTLQVDIAHRMFIACYLNSPDEKENPLASPLLAKSLDKMPPALIITAELDMLAKEGAAYAKMLEDAGVPVFHKEYKNLPHSFNFEGEDFGAAVASWNLMADRLKMAFCTP
jgi:acetyl esterase